MSSRTSIVQAIVLRGRALSESDRIMTVYSLERGKLDAVAKGIRRPKSALSGRLEFMTEVQLELYRARSLDVITGAQTVMSHWEAIVDPDAFAVTQLVAEFIDATCGYEDPDPEIYGLLSGFLRAVDSATNPRASIPRFEMRLLRLLGQGPNLDECARCGRQLENENAFVTPGEGGLVCSACNGPSRALLALDAADVENLRAIARSRHEPGGASNTARPRVAEAAESYIVHDIERRPRSLTSKGDVAPSLPRKDNQAPSAEP